MNNKRGTLRVILLLPVFVVALLSSFTLPTLLNSTRYNGAPTVPPVEIKSEPAKSEVLHKSTPEYVRAIYVSQCGATSAKLRAYIEGLLKETELNAVIIDVKDYSGTVSFKMSDGVALPGGKGCVVRDMAEWIEKLHKQDVYVIARITVFQDPLYAEVYPELAVHRRSATTTPWRDKHGLAFIDVGAREFWKYIVGIAQESHSIGFDELNFDYIRYPSDGNMRDVYYTHSGGVDGVVASREEELEKFFRYLTSRLRQEAVGHIPVLSADLFGMTTTNTDDLTIGQVQERAEPYFDYIAPMVYPSHYPSWFIGLDNPNENVYEVVKYSMSKAVERMVATSTHNASFKYNQRIGTSTPAIYSKPASSKYKLRPWLQDFNYGGDYDATKVRAQIQATYDSGLNSWMLWNPANRYTREALLPN